MAKAKKVKAPRRSNPCLGADIIKHTVPTQHWAVRLPFKPSTAQLIRYADHHCVTGEHEVLTRSGWVRFDQLLDGVEIAQWAWDRTISFAVPKLHTYPYDGGSLVSLQAKRLSLIATPNHRVPDERVRDGYSYQRTFELQSLPSRLSVPSAGNYEGCLDYTDVVALAIAIQADSRISFEQVIFSLRLERKILRLRTLLQRLQVDYKERLEPNGDTRITFRKDVIPEVFTRWLNGTKVFCFDSFLELTVQAKRSVLAELQLWDGCTSHREYYSTVKENAVVVHTLAHLAGVSATFSVRTYPNNPTYKPCYTVYFTRPCRSDRVTVDSRLAAQTDIKSVGPVYCVTVPTGLFLVKHSNKVHVTGNSHEKVMDYRQDPPRVTFDEKALPRLLKKYPDDPIYQQLVAYRGLEKAKGTYVDGIFVHQDERVRGTFNHNPSTLRLAMKDPSLQVMPRFDPKKPSVYDDIRGMFRTKDGKLFFAVDFGGIEAVIVHYLTAAYDMTSAEAGVKLSLTDIHSFFASHVLKHEGKIDTAADITWSPDNLAEYLHDIKKNHKTLRDVCKTTVHSCLTGEHEVLTPNGWVRFDELQDGVKVAQWKGSSLDFVTPSRVVREDYQGLMHTTTGRGISAVMTPNHRIPWVSTASVSSKLREFTADSLPARGHIPVTGVFTGGSRSWTALDALVVAVQADGHVTKTNRISFCLKKRSKIDRLHSLCTELGIGLTSYGDGQWGITVADARQVLSKFEQSELSAKKFSWSWLFEMSNEARGSFLDEVVLWDGHVKGHFKWYYSTSEDNARFVQTVAHLCGQQSLMRQWKQANAAWKPVWKVSFNRRKFASVKSTKWTATQTKTKVYCVTVPSGFFLVRHNNRISVTGNSHYKTTPFKMVLENPLTFPDTKTARYMQDFYFDLFPGVKKWWWGTCLSADRDGYITAPDGFRQYFPAAMKWEWDNTFKQWVQDYGPQDKECIAAVPQHMGMDYLAKAANVAFYESFDSVGQYMRLLIHDEIFLEVPEEMCDLVDSELQAIMRRPNLSMPLPEAWGLGPYLSILTEGKRGPTWKEMA